MHRCVLKEGNIDKAFQYAESALNEWKMYCANHPDDTSTNVNEFISRIERKRNFYKVFRGETFGSEVKF